MANGKWNEARSRLEQAFAAAPTDILIAFSLATAYRLSGAAEKAATLFEQLHNAAPEWPECAVGLAQSRADLGHPDGAVAFLRRFAMRQPDAAQIYAAIGDICLKSGRYEEAPKGFSRAVTLAPSAENHGNLAEALSLHRAFDAAEPHYERALRLAPDSPNLRLNYAIHLLSQGKVHEGWQAFEARLDPRLPDAPLRALSLPRWNGEQFADRHLLVVSEQGLGDEIRLAALLPEVAERVGRLTVECDPRLIPLFRRSFPGLDIHAFSRVKRGGHGHYSYGWLPERDGPDCYIELGSLAHILDRPLAPPRNRNSYLKPDPERARALAARLRDTSDGCPLVGISWASGARHFGRGTNYPPLRAWNNLLNLPDVRFVSLQYGEAGDDLRSLSELAGRQILRFPDLDLRNDLETLAALASSLDLVLSVGNATAALSGAVGTPTVEILSTPGWVPLIGGQDYFLAANHRCIQSTLGDWDGPVAEARELARTRLAQP
ncbi:tetratricopeptide repeat protein [Nisaea acidiphila]|uniref:Tetratricopeptide repeat protein n=1 Tax=Nisaea acidiphila TaxID=1862145 RepID=A0A9J7APZ6_9PROT|nr:tetratricopeptide repeat protein [Nisaea acidiphila]UUX49472.1 tetratricopeptide repeat protein [Nisaea acidiphila]